jgi:hypothetical protein
MCFIVEIRDKAGNTARKEYEGRSLWEVFCRAELDLTEYPQFTTNDVWEKGSRLPGFFGSRLS